MLRRIGIIGGIIAAVFIFCGKLNAQVIELACPSGTTSVQSLQTTDTTNGKLRQNYCVDSLGNVTENLTGSTTISSQNNIKYVDGIKYGLTDAGVNAAISDANTQGGGKVIISKPIVASTPILLKPKVQLECTGWETAPITSTITAPAAIINATQGNAVTDASVTGCRIIGPDSTVSGTTDIRGIELDEPTVRVALRNNKITNVSYGIWSTSSGNGCPTTSDIWIENNFIQTTTTQGIVTCGNHFFVRGNRIDSIGTTNLHQGIYVSGSTDALIQGNSISNTAGFCAQAFTLTVGVNNSDIRFIGNSCNISGTGTGGAAQGGMLAGFQSPSTTCNKILFQSNTIDNITRDRGIGILDCVDSTIEGNVIRNLTGTSSAGIFVTSTANGPIKHLAIVGNHITNVTGSGDPGIQILANGSTPLAITVTANSLDTIQGNGIEFDGVIDSSILDNRVKDYNNGGTGLNGIIVQSTSLRNLINGNSVSASNSTGNPIGLRIVSAADADNQLSSNVVINNITPISDSGTRTLIYGNKINSSDGNFRLSNGIPDVIQSCGTTSTCSKSIVVSPITVIGGPISLAAGTLTVTSLPFTSGTSYVCSPDDSTGINGIDVIYNSGSSVTFNGTGTDSIRYTCTGN